MNRSIVILKIIIFTWEVPGNDWPQTTVQHFNVFCCIYIVPSTLVKVPTPLYVMQPKIMAVIFLFKNTFRSECFIAFSNHNLALVRKKITFFQSSSGHRRFSLHHVTRCFLFTSRVRIFFLYTHWRYPLLRINIQVVFLHTFIFSELLNPVCNDRQWGFLICPQTSDNFSAMAIVQTFSFPRLFWGYFL
jgi:hypothetical protein